jgi:hypothetical protein
MKDEIINLLESGWGYDEIISEAECRGWSVTAVRKVLHDFIDEHADGAPDRSYRAKLANSIAGQMAAA